MVSYGTKKINSLKKSLIICSTVPFLIAGHMLYLTVYNHSISIITMSPIMMIPLYKIMHGRTVILLSLFYDALQRMVQGHEVYKCLKTLHKKYFEVCSSIIL